MALVPMVGALSVAALFGCSESPSVAGNSAETGSPELAGVLYLDGGHPAALARVQCVPFQFDALHDSLPGAFRTSANDSGVYLLDSVPKGTYSLEAFDETTGEMLLVQNIQIADSGRFTVSDTLLAPGFVLLNMDIDTLDGAEGYAVMTGTTVERPFKVDSNVIVVDSLPADTLQLQLRLNDGGTLEFPVRVPAGDTAFVWLKRDSYSTEEPPPDTIIHKFIAPLQWPSDADTSLWGATSDVPIALRLDSTNCDFSDFANLKGGRWEVFRVTSEGVRNKALPISMSYFDVASKRALFWIRLDGWELTDSLELVYNTGLSSGYALDVFPTSRVYTAVYHYDDGLTSGSQASASGETADDVAVAKGSADDVAAAGSSVAANGSSGGVALSQVVDVAEKQNYVGTAVGLTSTAGVIGGAAYFDGNSYMVVEGSAESDSTRKSDLNIEMSDYMSVSMWVRFDDMSRAQTLFAKGNSQYDFSFDPDSGFVMEQFHAGESLVDSTSDTVSYKMVYYGGRELVNENEWNFVTFNRAGKNAGLMVNGTVVKLTAATVAWAGTESNSYDLEVGRKNGADGACKYFKGAIDELFISNAARTDAWNMVTYLNQRPTQMWPKLTAE